MPALDELLKGALTLGEDDRAALAEQLLASLNEDGSDSEEQIEAMWTAEAQRRLEDHRAGLSEAPQPAEAVAEQVHQRFS